MAKPPELWAFLLTNAGLFLVSSLLAVLCYFAYRHNRGQRSYAVATIGFGFVVLGGLVEPVYQVSVGVEFTLTGTEFMLLEAVETVLIAVGLGLLFYAITQHGPGGSASMEAYPGMTDEDRHWTRKRTFGD